MKWYSPLSWWSTLRDKLTKPEESHPSVLSYLAGTMPDGSKPPAKRGRPKGSTNTTRKSKPTASQSSSKKKPNSGTKARTKK